MQLVDSVPSINIKSLKDNPELNLVSTSAAKDFVLDLNTKVQPFSNKLVRQAIAYAIDRDELVKMISNGFGVIEPFNVMKSQWYYSPSGKYNYDPAKAKELLTQAGYPSGFKAKLSFVSREPDKTIVELVQAQLKKAGIDADIETYDRLSWIDKWKKNEGQIGLSFIPIPKPDPDVQLRQFFYSKGNNNWPKYANQQFDSLIDQGNQTYDMAKRKDIYKQAQDILVDDAPYIFMFQQPVYEAYSKKLQDVKIDPEGAWLLGSAWLKN